MDSNNWYHEFHSNELPSLQQATLKLPGPKTVPAKAKIWAQKSSAVTPQALDKEKLG